MAYIDSHCHLDFSVLSTRLEQVLNTAKLADVTEFIVPSVSSKNFQAVSELANNYPCIHSALGMHPCFMDVHTQADLVKLAEAIEQYKPCAVGEIGLDYFITRDQSSRARQLSLFKAQLLIAKQVKLPVILHVRKAHDEVLNCLKSIGFDQGGIVHAFNGSAEQARRYTKQFGFKLGFGGAITHSRATKLRGLAASLPLSDIVFETDAPDMPLADMLDAYNQPANISRIAEVLFSLREENPEEIRQQIRLNTQCSLRLTGL